MSKSVALILIVLLPGACAWAPPQDIPGPIVVTSSRAPLATVHSPVLRTAQSMLGIRYQYGGQSPDTGFDCSGLVYYAHQVNGLNVPRTAKDLYRAATPVHQDQLNPGDLLFFRTHGSRISHVGFYVGPGRFLHAPSTGKSVTIADYRNSYWRTRFAGAGRLSR